MARDGSATVARHAGGWIILAWIMLMWLVLGWPMGKNEGQVHDEEAGVSAGSEVQYSGSYFPSLMIDINTASAAELMCVPGVGETLAARILDYRTRHGRFACVDELERVPGIGPKLLAEFSRHLQNRQDTLSSTAEPLSPSRRDE